MIVERSPFTVEMDAINSFSVDLLPSTMVKFGVDAVGDLFMWCRSGSRIWM